MTCAEFLQRYTDVRDGLITAPRELRRFERHLAHCAACRRYDTAVRRGVIALQAAGTIEPSREFRRRLDARLARERRAPGAGRSHSHRARVRGTVGFLSARGWGNFRPVWGRSPWTRCAGVFSSARLIPFIISTARRTC